MQVEEIKIIPVFFQCGELIRHCVSPPQAAPACRPVWRCRDRWDVPQWQQRASQKFRKSRELGYLSKPRRSSILAGGFGLKASMTSRDRSIKWFIQAVCFLSLGFRARTGSGGYPFFSGSESLTSALNPGPRMTMARRCSLTVSTKNSTSSMRGGQQIGQFPADISWDAPGAPVGNQPVLIHRTVIAAHRHIIWAPDQNPHRQLPAHRARSGTRAGRTRRWQDARVRSPL